MVWCWSEDGNLDGTVGVGDVNQKSFVVIVKRVCRYDKRYAEVDGTRHSDVVVVKRLSGVRRVSDDNTERTYISLTTYDRPTAAVRHNLSTIFT